jgi:cytochrome c peroxidase
MRITQILVVLVVCALSIYAYTTARAQTYPDPLDEQLRQVISQEGLTQLDPGPQQDDTQVKLGRWLYYDKILSGNRDTSCATCHHHDLATADAIPLPIGTGGQGLGPNRERGEGRPFVPRNSPEVFNRLSPEWRTMFWDSRAEQNMDGTFSTPFGDALPEDLPNVLAVQAMFPVNGRNELRGLKGDRDVFGDINEIAQIDDGNPQAVWDAVMARLLAIPEYRDQFQTAFPYVAESDLGFEHAATAIAAFEGDVFTFTNSPWDQYLAGNNMALSDPAKRGALLFYGKANCSSCHSGNLLTDQEHYNLAVPQIGPGKGQEAPLDLGRGRVVSKPCGGPADSETDQHIAGPSQSMGLDFAFRTPPLRNVSLTGPYMHNGAFSTLESAVRHHLEPENSLRSYDVAQHLPPELQDTFQDDPSVLDDLTMMIAPVAPTEPLTDAEFNDLIAFLEALSDPAAQNINDAPPDSVPSGLPISIRLPTVYIPTILIPPTQY